MTEIAQINGLPQKQDALDTTQINNMLEHLDRLTTYGQDLGVRTQREIDTIDSAHEMAIKEDEVRRLGGMGIHAA